jgi:glycosyltransferase involved in cell wall biosynthesis
MLKENHSLDFEVVFTGKEFDFRSPDYTTHLKNYVEQNGLSPYVKFLGFIDRKEQLQLMNHALAIIQPSLFEGWSTVVEDAKAMNQFLLVSDIPVHREQLKQQAYFFNPQESQDLINLLLRYLDEMPTKQGQSYHVSIEQFARNFLSIIRFK